MSTRLPTAPETPRPTKRRRIQLSPAEAGPSTIRSSTPRATWETSLPTKSSQERLAAPQAPIWEGREVIELSSSDEEDGEYEPAPYDRSQWPAENGDINKVIDVDHLMNSMFGVKTEAATTAPDPARIVCKCRAAAHNDRRPCRGSCRCHRFGRHCTAACRCGSACRKRFRHLPRLFGQAAGTAQEDVASSGATGRIPPLQPPGPHACFATWYGRVGRPGRTTALDVAAVMLRAGRAFREDACAGDELLRGWRERWHCASRRATAPREGIEGRRAEEEGGRKGESVGGERRRETERQTRHLRQAGQVLLLQVQQTQTEKETEECEKARLALAQELVRLGCGAEGSLAGFYFSFCQRQWLDRVLFRHCWYCRRCVGRRHWHCRRCETCRPDPSQKCEGCGGVSNIADVPCDI